TDMVESATAAQRGRAQRIRTVAYWFFTVLVAYEMVAGALWAVIQLDFAMANLRHLGYPPYVNKILGAWDAFGAWAVLGPGFVRLKEWAYAGAFFNYSGAVASHLYSGDGPSKLAPALFFAVFTIASWALRPPDRRCISATPDGEIRRRAW